MATTTNTAPPERSLDQRHIALKRANAVRAVRADWKAAPKRNEPRRPPQDVIRAPGDAFATMKVTDLLISIPKVGRVKARRCLIAGRISEHKTLGGLSERQRGELAAILVANGYDR